MDKVTKSTVKPAYWGASVLLGASLLLSACGGDSNSLTDSNSTISGTAATGAALTSGMVNLSCKGSLTRTANISPTGAYSTTVPIANLPCALKATSGATTLFSFTAGTGSRQTANITPLTTLTLANLLGANPSTVFASLTETQLANLNPVAIQAAITALNAVLANYALPAGFNPVTTPLTAAAPGQAGNAYDGLLDQFKAANSDLAALITAAVGGTMPSLAPPAYTAGAADLAGFFSTFKGDYSLSVSDSGAEGTNNAAVTALFPQGSARTVHIKANGDISIDGVGRTISYLASTYAGNTTGSSVMARTEFVPNESGKNVLRYRSISGFPLDIYLTYDPSNGQLEVAPSGFVNNEGYASLKGRIVAPPAALPPVTTGCTGGSGTSLKYEGNTGASFTNGQVVCFTTISTTTLAFAGKTLTSPVQNTVVTAPYSAWKYTDGGITYEVIFNNSALHEINVSQGSTFLGQFAPPVTAAPPTISSFSPSSGAVGSTVTITGTGFSLVPPHNVVRFSTNVAGPGPVAEVVDATATQIVVKVPAGAVTGGISVYNYDADAVVSSASSFTVTGGSGGSSLGAQAAAVTISATAGQNKTATDIAALAGTYTGTIGKSIQGGVATNASTCTITSTSDGTITVSANGVSYSATMNGEIGDQIVKPTAAMVKVFPSSNAATTATSEFAMVTLVRGYVIGADANYGQGSLIEDSANSVSCDIPNPHQTTLGSAVTTTAAGGATASDVPASYAGTYSDGTCSVTIGNDGVLRVQKDTTDVSAQLGGDEKDYVQDNTATTGIVALIAEDASAKLTISRKVSDGTVSVNQAKQGGSLVSAVGYPNCQNLVKQ